MDNQVTPAEYADGVVAFQFDGDIELAFNYLVDKHSQAMHLSYCYCQLRNREKEQVWLRKARRYEEAAEHCLELL